MSIFGSIMSAIFGKAQAAPGGGATAAPAGGAASAGAPAPGGGPAGGASGGAPAGGTAQNVDVEAVLNELASKNPEKLNWRTSIVDLMKLLKLDSGLGARKELAKELGYTGSTDDSATMNVWLHKQVMKKLADNGGKVPADLH